MSRLYFERFREALAAHAEGVHRLADPAPPLRVAALSARLRGPLSPAHHDFLLSWDGAELFHEDLRVFSCDRCAEENLRARADEGFSPALILAAESAGGDRYALDSAGAVFEFEADSGLRWLAGSRFD